MAKVLGHSCSLNNTTKNGQQLRGTYIKRTSMRACNYTMTTTTQYKAAIEAVNDAVRHSDRSTWFPKVVERTRDAAAGTTRVVFEVDGAEAAYFRKDGPALACPEFDEPQANALLHLVSDPSRACAIFACPVRSDPITNGEATLAASTSWWDFANVT